MVSTALYTGLAGLRSHQTHIDVIGANLANVSTPGYRGARMTFSDILSFTVRPGSGPNGNFGGINPLQIGLGSTVGSIDINTNQGTFQDTGRPLDVALQGRGFFSLTDGRQNFFTRVGTFGVDAERLLVDTRSGFRVLGADGSNIRIPDADTLPARATSNISFTGALPATVSGPLTEVVESEAIVLEGTAATKTATAPFNLAAFDGKSLLIAVNGGAQQRVTINASDFPSGLTPATAAELASVINAQTTGIQASTNGAGGIDFATDRLGETATLKFDDASDSTGMVTALGLNTTLVSGTQTAATGATNLANLTTRVQAYVPGDTIAVAGTNVDGTPFSATFTYGVGNDGETVQSLLDFTNALIATDASGPTATAALNADGNIELRARDKGPASLSLDIGDSTSATKNAWSSFRTTQNGTGPDTATAAIDVVDSLGVAHPVSFTFTRSATDDSVWDLTADLNANQGTIDSDTIASISFNTDGSFNVVGSAQSSLSFTFAGAAQQSVAIDLGSSGSFDGVTMLGSSTNVAATDQDGFGPGTLLNIGIDGTGNINGFYSNGQSQQLAQLRISIFANEGGLLRAGDTMFTQSPNSDDPITTTAGAAGAGTIRAGALESSNVDIAEEFVNLIEAQRGFQANSRIITTTDEILAELVNIVR